MGRPPGGIYGGGTFRVAGSTAGIAFTNRYATVYNTAAEMWNGLINWGSIKSRLTSQTSGSEAGAAIIEQGLKHLDQSLTNQNSDLTDTERQYIQEILNDSAGSNYSLFSFGSKLSRTARGFGFEDRMAKILAKITDGSYSDIWTGKHQTVAGMDVRLIVDTTGFKKSYRKIDIWNALKEQLGIEYEKFINAVSLEVEKDFQTDHTSVIIRQARKFGKVDLEGKFNMVIDADLSQDVKDMAQEMKGHTFSLKNYQGSTMKGTPDAEGKVRGGWGGISLGYAEDFRAYGSFYYGATGDNNFGNQCTFIFSSLKSGNETVKRYLSWARFIYELVGLGLTDVSVPGSNALVDYLIINNSDARKFGRIKVIWVGSFFKDMPNGWAPYHAVEVYVGKDKTTGEGKFTTKHVIYSKDYFSGII